ncbi:MAG: hypothetical protein AAF363_18145 [Bacteroidota bacterium]
MLTNNVVDPKGVAKRRDTFINRKNLHNEIDEKLLLYDLNRAVKLSNLYKESVLIKYTDRNGYHREKDTMVLTVTERYVVLKGGSSIPIENIERVIL